MSFAAPRTLSEAKQIAQRFMTEKTGHRISDSAILLPGTTRAGLDDQPYYIFNDTEKTSFVIVSGSDMIREVIGYSTSASIPENAELPDNLRSWLQWISDATQYLELHPEAALTTAELQSTTTPIETLMDTQWNQSPLYNKYCPPVSPASTKLCPTGCVATAAAQVVRYHLVKGGKVITGKGSKSYSRNGVSHSVDYAANTYDYTKMPLELSNESTEEEIDEVAKLCYHIGVGVHMDYASGGSGAFTSVLPTTLIENFGFNSNYRQLDRRMYDFSEWNAILINELQNDRPIIYGGQSSTGGHCFVLDGLDANGLYHVNWGWGGKSDGYFDVNILRPSDVGTGASVSQDGYISFCSASVNLCLEEGVGKLPCLLYLDVKQMTLTNPDLSCGEQLQINKVIVYNQDAYNASGTIGYTLISSTGDVVESQEITDIEDVSGVNPDNGSYAGLSFSFAAQIPSTLANGDYKLYFTYKSKDGSVFDIIRGVYPSVSYVLLKVKDGKVNASIPLYETKLKASDWKAESETIAAETPTPISVKVTNASSQTFVGKFFATLISSIGVEASTFESSDVPAIAPGETATINFNVTFPSATTWTVRLTTKRQAVGDVDYEEVSEGTAIFTATSSPTGDANFLMTDVIKILTEGPIGGNEKFKVRLTLTNSGTEYSGEFGLQFFTSRISKDVRAETYCPVTFGTTSSTVDIELTMPELKEGSTYYVRAAYLKGSNYQQFSVKDGVTAYTTITAGKTALDDIVVNGQTEVYDIHGNKISIPENGSLSKGIYIMNGNKVIAK